MSSPDPLGSMRQKRGVSPHCVARGAHRVGPLHHGLDEGRGLIGAGTNSLSPSFPEQSGHRSFIGQAELALVLGNTEG